MRKINYPLIVSDFDGTLVNADGTIAEENKRAIEEYVAAGGAFAISTGRLPAGILPRAQALGLKGLVSCCQGAVILDIQSKEVVIEERLRLETTLAACRKMEELGLHIHAYDLWDFYANVEDEPLHIYERLVGTKAKLVTDEPLSAFLEREQLPCYKLLAMVEPKDSERVLSALKKADIGECAFTKSAAFLVEVINPKHSKGTAVEFLAKHYGVPLSKTIAVGDQHNDLPMIERAGLGIAVKNADEGLKAKADYVCEYTNEEGAIAKIIEKFGFYGEA